MEQKGHVIQVLKKNQKTVSKNKWLMNFLANLLLLISGFLVSISGLIIQIHYHIRHNSNHSTVLSLDRMVWYSVHVWISIIFLFIIVYHIWIHKKWYKNIFNQKKSPNKKPTIVLTILMVITAITGFVPLLIYFFDKNSIPRLVIIEIHDKIAILFLIIIFLHTKKRLKWYANVVKNKIN